MAYPTVTKQQAADYLGCSLKDLKDHVYLVTEGTAELPQNFWKYKAYTKKEFQALDQPYIREII